MTETLRVDTSLLSAAASKLSGVADGMPQAPQVGSFGGGDKLSEAISAQATKVVDPVVAKLPQVKDAFAKYADNVSAASSTYETTDDRIAADVRQVVAAFDSRFGTGASPAGGGSGGGATGSGGGGKSGGGSGSGGGGGSSSNPSSSGAATPDAAAATPASGADGMSQLGQFMQMPMQMAQQAAQVPGQMLGSLSQIPQQVMQGVQGIVQAATQGAGQQQPENPQDADKAADDKGAADGKPGESKAEGPDQGRAPVDDQKPDQRPSGAKHDGQPERAGAGGDGGQRAPVAPNAAPGPRHARPADPAIDV
jgi:hypothetical protein